MISVYGNLIDNEVNIRKQENFQRYNRLIQWGRKHPTRFIEKVLGIQLLDYQNGLLWGRGQQKKLLGYVLVTQVRPFWEQFI